MYMSEEIVKVKINYTYINQQIYCQIDTLQYDSNQAISIISHHHECKEKKANNT